MELITPLTGMAQGRVFVPESTLFAAPRRVTVEIDSASSQVVELGTGQTEASSSFRWPDFAAEPPDAVEVKLSNADGRDVLQTVTAQVTAW